MTPLANWLREQLQARDLTQRAAASQAGVSMATLSDILRKGHIPKVDILFRLADAFDLDRVEILRLSGHLKPADQLPGAPSALSEGDDLTQQLIRQFHQVPDVWKEEVVDLVAMFVRIAKGSVARDESRAGQG
ncbi:helix-turn-helix domain-containing protein [Chloroflexota bacterium]